MQSNFFSSEYKNMIKKIFLLITVIAAFFITSCKTTNLPLSPSPITEPEVKEYHSIISRKLLGTGLLTPAQLTKFFLSQNQDADPLEILNFACDYIAEANAENINSDVAFAQMCLETGYLRFGNLVTPEMHNYCGLGAMDAEHPGCEFPTRTLGIRAHIQHLQAYATTAEIELNQELIDPRYSWVHKTKYTEDINGLSGTWATDPHYAEKIEKILIKMEGLK